MNAQPLERMEFDRFCNLDDLIDCAKFGLEGSEDVFISGVPKILFPCDYVILLSLKISVHSRLHAWFVKSWTFRRQWKQSS